MDTDTAERRICATCEHEDDDGRDEPCAACADGNHRPNWTPKAVPVPANTRTQPDLRCSTCKHKGGDETCDLCVSFSKWTPTPATPLDQQVGGDHYRNMAIQPVEYIMANKLGFCEGLVIEHVSRWRDKGGVEDLRKARHFLDLLIDSLDATTKRGNDGDTENLGANSGGHRRSGYPRL